MRTRPILLGLVLVSFLSSLLTARSDATPVCSTAPLAFGSPVVLGGPGYEPGIEIDSAGTIFVTAHKQSPTNQGTRLASWLWRSIDGGSTWSDMNGLATATRQMFAFEGDFAVDGLDRLYFVDTTLGDNHFYRYSDHGATLDMVRPGVFSYELDDRPWLAAHHDGYVYYLSNTGAKHDGRLTIHRSTDGGATFDPIGFTFPNSGWGFIDADPNSDYVYGVFDNFFYGQGIGSLPTRMTAWISPDRGQTWTSVDIDGLDNDFTGDGFPNVAVSPVDGSVYALWSDGPNVLKLARSTDHGTTWSVYDITPFAGTFTFPWVTVAPNGSVGVIFHGATPTAAGRVYGMIWRESSDCLTDANDPLSVCTGQAWRVARLQTGTAPRQVDFFQNEFTPTNALAVPYQANDNLIRFVKQTSGPNLAGEPFCGTTGSP
jgi:hypothetical protein